MPRTVLISGAGSGIGRALARSLGKNPDINLILLGRRSAPLQELIHELPGGERHMAISASQSNRVELQQALQRADLPRRNLVAVVANAGVSGENHYGKEDRWDEIIATNLTGTYCLVNECLPALRRSTHKPRNIVLVSSILARLGVPGYSAYCASKAGLLGLMRSMASEYARESILVNALCPGWVNTAMATEGIQKFADNLKMSYEEALAAQLSMVPTRRMSEPEEVAALIAFLLSDQQQSFTGQCFDINNGALMP